MSAGFRVWAAALMGALLAGVCRSAEPEFDENLSVLISDIHLQTDPSNGYSFTAREFPRRVREILAMRPLPRRVICFGDMTFNVGESESYAFLRKQIRPLEETGILVVLGMGNHDRRKNFLAAFPEAGRDQPVPGRIVHKVDLGTCDLVLLDTLSGSEESKFGEIGEEQGAWLVRELMAAKRPVILGAHHSQRELKVGGRPIFELLRDSEKVVGWINGHDHCWKKETLFWGGGSNEDVIRSLTLPTAGAWGEIGLVTLRTHPDRAVATLKMIDMVWHDALKPGERRPKSFDAIVSDQNGERVTFPFERPMLRSRGSAQEEIAKWDPAMAQKTAVVEDGLKWIDGKLLPIEGRAFDDVDHYYDRLPGNVTTNVNGGVRLMKHHTTGMLFRFRTDSKRLTFKWVPYSGSLSMDHQPATGTSGIDVYRFDAKRGKWLYVKTGRIWDAEKGGTLSIDWTPGTPCLVNLPTYNGIRSFALGIDPTATVEPLGPRKSGVEKPVVFYGTSITHGGCCTRPGLSFVNWLGRDLDVPVVNLGFSGSGKMELEMSEHLARIDASCYVLDCLWNMRSVASGDERTNSVEENYEPFIRNLRAKRPGVPIVMAESSDVYFGECPRSKHHQAKDRVAKALFEKLIAEGWTDLVYLPNDEMYTGDYEGTVDGVHPNDLGMMSMAKAFGKAVKTALRMKN